MNISGKAVASALWHELKEPFLRTPRRSKLEWEAHYEERNTLRTALYPLTVFKTEFLATGMLALGSTAYALAEYSTAVHVIGSLFSGTAAALFTKTRAHFWSVDDEPGDDESYAHGAWECSASCQDTLTSLPNMSIRFAAVTLGASYFMQWPFTVAAPLWKVAAICLAAAACGLVGGISSALGDSFSNMIDRRRAKAAGVIFETPVANPHAP